MTTRLSDEAIDELDRGAKSRGMTKRQFLEEAIRLRAKQDEREVWLAAVRSAAGSMQRDEPVEETVANMRRAWSDEWDRREREFEQIPRAAGK